MRTRHDHYGIDTGYRYGYICQDCGYAWGQHTHPGLICLACLSIHTRRVRPVARLTRQQMRRWRDLARQEHIQ